MGWVKRMFAKMGNFGSKAIGFGKKVLGGISSGVSWVKNKVIRPLGKMPLIGSAMDILKSNPITGPYANALSNTWNTVDKLNEGYKAEGIKGLAEGALEKYGNTVVPKAEEQINKLKKRVPFGLGRLADIAMNRIPKIQRYRHPTAQDIISTRTKELPQTDIPPLRGSKSSGVDSSAPVESFVDTVD